jgi:hypothetical protein
MKNDSKKKSPQAVSPNDMKKINVSAGVIAGNKLGGMTPQYPPIATSHAKQKTKANKVKV